MTRKITSFFLPTSIRCFRSSLFCWLFPLNEPCYNYEARDPEVRNERLFIATIAVAPAIQSSKSKTQEFLQKQNQTDASNKHNQQNIPFSNLPSNSFSCYHESQFRGWEEKPCFPSSLVPIQDLSPPHQSPPEAPLPARRQITMGSSQEKPAQKHIYLLQQKQEDK